MSTLTVLISESDIPNREEADKKRKHDEILTDQGSEEESDDDDLVDFDLDNYESEDDPDYEVKIKFRFSMTHQRRECNETSMSHDGR